jgi:hypothetical protein
MKRLLGILAAIALVLALAPVPAIASGTSGVTIYEDGSYGGDYVCFNYTATCAGGSYSSNLQNVSAGLHNGCDTSWIGSIGWDNCASSYKATVYPGQCIVMYGGTSYGQPTIFAYNNTATTVYYYNVSYMGTYNDALSSLIVGAPNSRGGCS